MAHNIGQMFYVGERTWHGLGTRLPQLATLDEAIDAGGLNYTVALAPLALAGEYASEVAQRMAVVREDRKPGEAGRVLGVVHPDFMPLQNRDGAKMFDALFGNGTRVYETGGFLKQGEIVWLQAKLPEPIDVTDDDRLDTYLLFSNSHDGSYAIDIRLTTVRVVCNNTLNFALRDRKKGLPFRRAHNQTPDQLERDAATFFREVLAEQKALQLCLKRLASTPCADPAFKTFIEKLLPLPVPPTNAASDAKQAAAHATRCANIVANRASIGSVFDEGHADSLRPGVHVGPGERTWWGALNAVTAWVDHCQDVTGHRFAHTMFGSGSRLKTAAYASALRRAEPTGAGVASQ